jgi:murein tripeptide amidase MpaA
VPDRPTVVRINDPSKEDLARLARHLDIWSVDPKTQAATAAVSDEELRWLRSEGFDVAPVSALNITPLTIPDYPCYRTVEELDAQIARWESDHPRLVERIIIGESYEGRELAVLRLGVGQQETTRPTLFVIAGIHGRELITNEVAASFVERLLTRYNVDPNVTWLLDHHTIYVLITANPDGHVKNEPGWPWAYWRKNTNPTYGCSEGSYGVDLNRNSSFEWLPPDTQDPYRFCGETYPGPTAHSESETEAIEAFARTIFPDQRASNLWTPAPEDATGVFITLHSYSNLVLWPWSHTYDAAPNDAQLARLGGNLASFNGYLAQQGSDLYPAAGTTDGYTYGELGIASYTFEIGSSFYPACSKYDALVEPNLDALLYAARVARAPYQIAFGPDVLAMDEIAPVIAPQPNGIPVRATLGYRGWRGPTISDAEAYVDTPPWQNGTAIPLNPVDGVFDASSETVSGAITPTLSIGRHRLYVRGRGENGEWGPVSAAFVDVNAPFVLSPEAVSTWERPGSTVTVPFTLTNVSNLTYTVALTNIATTWQVALAPVTTTLSSGEVVPVTLPITIPPHALQWPYPTETITLTARAVQTPTLYHTAVVHVESRPFMLWFPRFFKNARP